MVVLASSLAFHPRPPREALEEAGVMGFSGVEFLCEPPWHPGGWSREEREAVRELAEEDALVLSLHAPVADVNLMSPHPEVRALAESEIAAALELAAEIGAGSVTFHLGYRPLMGAPHAPPWEEALEAIRRLNGRAQALGVALCLENDPRLPGAYLWDLARMREVLSELGLAGTLDIGHAWTAYGEGALELLPELMPSIHTVHLHDNRGRLDEHLALGEGVVDVAKAWPLLSRASLLVIETKTHAGLKNSLSFLQRL